METGIDLRDIPSVDQLLQTRTAAELIAVYGRPLTLDAIRTTLNGLREAYAQQKTIPHRDGILTIVQQRLKEWTSPTLISVVNASGVVLHTNLGRAPLSREALEMVQNIGWGYSSLEYDLENGTRGSRSIHAEALLTRLTGAEAALVVNNNASAVLLVLSALARRRRVVIARSQLVEIGGGFRIPDVMAQSGAKLIEIGTTNRTHLEDYDVGMEEPTAMVLHAHSSNFKIIGFTSEPTLAEVVSLAHERGILVMDDLGSGALLDTAQFGLGHEPMVQESVAAGVDVVCFSGDKLLGGPQAGIIIGRKELLAKIKRHPLARAVRADKICIAALTATLMHYLKGEAERKIPIWQMLSLTPKQIRARVKYWIEEIGTGEIIPGESTVGGGSLPGETLATSLLAIKVPQPNRFLARLRKMNPPIIARVQEDLVVLDPRTVLPEQEGALLVGLQNALMEHSLNKGKKP